MSWTEQAEGLAQEAAETGRAIADLNAAAWSAGVDPEAVTGITGAALSLAAPVDRLWARSRQLRDDVALRDAAADFEIHCAYACKQGADLLGSIAADYTAACATMRDKKATAAQVEAARRRIGDCEAAREILSEICARLEYAANALYRVPDDMAQVYEAPYQHLAAGGALPHDGEFLTGAELMTNV